MLLQLLLFLLPIAALSGWYLGFKHQRDSLLEFKKENFLHQDYFLALNYLINEQPDKAVDVFIKVLEVNSDTVEMHLALGSLFRRQGEVDRAIRIHQNLIARPQLIKEQRIKALSELGQDYLRAGVLDRAERLFLELLEINDEDLPTYKNLLNIYEKQKDWRQAIAIAKKFINIRDNYSWVPLAYYYCELVNETLSKGLVDEAQVYLKKALVYDKNCVRASILLAKLEFDAEHYKNALRYYKQVKEQDADFVSEIASLLLACCEKLEKIDEGIEYLKECFAQHPVTLLALFLIHKIKYYYGDKAAVKFIMEQGERSSSLLVLDCLLELYLNEYNLEPFKNDLLYLRRFLGRLLANRPLYRCSNCGLGVKQLYWQCPGCKRWGIMKPIKKFEVNSSKEV